MPLPEPNSSTTVGPEKCNVAESQYKDFKLTILNMFKDLKESMSEYFNEVCKKHK